MATNGDFPFLSAWVKARSRGYGRIEDLIGLTVPGASSAPADAALKSWFFDAAAASGYSLSFATMAYTVTYGNVGLVSSRRIVVDTQSYALGLGNIGLSRGYRFQIDSSGYSYALGSVGFTRSYAIQFAASAYNYALGAVGLSVGRRLVLDSAQFVGALGVLGLYVNRTIQIDGASYSYSLGDVAFEYGDASPPASSGRKLIGNSRRGRSLDVDDPESSVAEIPQDVVADKPSAPKQSQEPIKRSGKSLVDISRRAANETLAQVARNAEKVAAMAAEKAAAAYAAQLLREAEEQAQLAQEIALLEALILEEQRIEMENEEAAQAFMAYLMAA